MTGELNCSLHVIKQDTLLQRDVHFLVRLEKRLNLHFSQFCWNT